jgi:hypothetical protein
MAAGEFIGSDTAEDHIDDGGMADGDFIGGGTAVGE